MRKKIFPLISLLLFSSPLLFADEETNPSSAERNRSTVRHFAGGVKQVAYDGPKDFAKEMVTEVPKKPPLVAVVEGINEGAKKLLDHTVRGTYRVATLGTSELESYEIQEPEKGSGDLTKIKISIPGT